MVIITNDPEISARANLSGFAKTIEIDRTSLMVTVQLEGIPEVPNGTIVEIPIDEATDEQDNLDPSRVLKWLFRKLNDALNNNDAE